MITPRLEVYLTIGDKRVAFEDTLEPVFGIQPLDHVKDRYLKACVPNVATSEKLKKRKDSVEFLSKEIAHAFNELLSQFDTVNGYEVEHET